MLSKGERTFVVRDMGGFVARINMPGWLKARPSDHGHGALAIIVESYLEPGRAIALHEHRNDEIISWVPDGVMRHKDMTAGELVTDRDHLMVMNSGRSFWHSEETLPSDPPLRMLQIFVRPYAIDLDPNIQHGRIIAAEMNTWRHLVGPQGGDAPFFVRNQVDIFDIKLSSGAAVDFPRIAGRDLYFYVFSGTLIAERQTFGEGEQGLFQSDDVLPIVTTSQSQVVAFLIDPNATLTKRGTVADHRRIPPPIVLRALRAWRRLRKFRWQARSKLIGRARLGRGAGGWLERKAEGPQSHSQEDGPHGK